MRYTLASLVALATAVAAQDASIQQSLVDSLAGQQNAQVFASFLQQDQDHLVSQVLGAAIGNGTATNFTILIPDDAAMNQFITEFSNPESNISLADVTAILSYHVLIAPLNQTNFSQSQGLTIPTLLNGSDANGVSYNLRQSAPQLQAAFGSGATGQVLFAQPASVNGTVKLRTRQDSGGGDATNVAMRAGEDQTVTMTVVDGKWAYGYYQIVNAVLDPPRPCSKTTRGLTTQLSALDVALNKTQLWATLDTAPNVTCLAPSTEAFQAAGSPEQNLPVDQLKNALLDHTLKGPAYTNFLVDGMKLETVSNKTIQITVNATGTYFNDAKVIKSNVLTNNGLIHVLDKVMTVPDATSSSTPSSTATGGQSTATGDKNAAPVNSFSGAAFAVAALAAAALV